MIMVVVVMRFIVARIQCAWLPFCQGRLWVGGYEPPLAERGVLGRLGLGFWEATLREDREVPLWVAFYSEFA